VKNLTSILFLLIFSFLISGVIVAQNYEQLAKDHIISNTSKYAQQHNKDNLLVVDQHTSEPSGLTHVYINQMYDGIKIYNAVTNISFDTEGKFFYGENRFINHSTTKKATPSLTSIEAVNRVASHFGQNSEEKTLIKTAENNKQSRTILTNEQIASTDIAAELIYIQQHEELVLCWSIAYEKSDDHFWWDTKVDALTGKIIEKTAWTIECNIGNGEDSCSHNKHTHSISSQTYSNDTKETNILAANDYRVIPYPYESPIHGNGETSIVNAPWNNILDPAANPFTGFPGQSWHHDGTTTHFTTRGNNVWAVEDRDNDNDQSLGPSPASQLSGVQQYNYSTDFNDIPIIYKDAAIVNLFYWNNLIHDIIYPYGFNEAAGNFQETNATNQGIGGDAVQADAQDGRGNNNANFATPPDGTTPRMQMYEWTYTVPSRDSDYDNGIIIHEYGHGISNRLTGGASNVGCLRNYEQMGEGWSDYFGLILTMKPGDTREQPRGMGTYMFGQPISGTGIRPSPYSTDFGINNYTYGKTSSAGFPGELSVPHGVGFVWCTTLWDMTWDLIDVYGFGTDIYDNDIANVGSPQNPGTFGGQNLALQLVMEGLKLQPCKPGFVEGRDAIIAADQALYNGIHKCLIWDAFAKRGVGVNAKQGSSGIVSDNIENFDSGLTIQKNITTQFTSVDSLIEFDLIMKGNPCEFQTNVVITETLDPRLSIVSVVCPASLTSNVVDNVITINNSGLTYSAPVTCQVVATVNTDLQSSPKSILVDDFESGTGSWFVRKLKGDGTDPWTLVNTASNSPVHSWYVPTTDGITKTTALESPVFSLSESTTLSFFHQINTHSIGDGGFLQISTNGGNTWVRVPGSDSIQNGYNGTLIASSNPAISGEAWSGDSGGFIESIIYLGRFAPSDNAKIRFVFGQNHFTTVDGWWIDDVKITEGEYLNIPTTACIVSSQTSSPVCDDNDIVLKLNDGPIQSPYNGVAHSIPGTIQAEEYDFGGQDVAYNDNMLNEADEFTGEIVRPGDFTDIVGAIGSESSIVAWFINGDWMEYTVDIEAGIYEIEVFTSSANQDPGSAVLSLDNELLATIDVASTGGWSDYEYFGVETIEIPQRINSILKLEVSGASYNVDYIKFTKIGEPCNDAQVISSQVQDPAHDGSEFTYAGNTGFNTIFTSTHVFSYIPARSSQSISALKFDNINVAQGTTVLEAYIEFTCFSESTGDVSIDITGEDVDNPVDFEETDYHISTRKQNNETNALVKWMPQDWSTGQKYRTVDISGVIQEIVNRDGFISGNAIALFLSGEDTNALRVAATWSPENNRGATLYISILDPLNDTDGDGVCNALDVCPNGDDTLDENENGVPDACETFCSEVSMVGHDAVEFNLNGNAGFNSVHTSNLIFSYIPTQNSQSISAIKFENINVSQGVTIEEAYIEFTAIRTQSGNISIDITGEDVDNPLNFLGDDFHISTRKQNNETNALISWTPEAWIEGEVYSTADISPIIQEIVDRNGFEFGNGIALFFDGEDTNSSRNAQSYSIENNNGPRLCISLGNTIIDSDGDGVPDDVDICPGGDDTIDENENGIPDACEDGCQDSIVEMTNAQIVNNKYAVNYIRTNGVVPAGNTVEYKAGQFIDLLSGFEVELGSEFTLEIENCSEVPSSNNAKIRLYKIDE